MMTDPNPFDLCDRLYDVACELSALQCALAGRARPDRDERIADGLSIIVSRQIRAIDAVVKELHPLREEEGGDYSPNR